MSGLKTLLKKEFIEQIKTYKLVVISGIFLMFGFATPLMINYLPELLEMSGEDIIIEIPPATALQALSEYSATALQIGILVAVLVAMGAIAQERVRGTAHIVFSKPVSRGAFVTAKLIALSTSFITGLTLGGVACYAYTTILIEDVNLAAFAGQNALLAVFFVFCLALILFLSSIFRNQLAAGGVALAALVGQALMVQLPFVGDYLPGRLTDWGIDLISGSSETAWGAMIATVILTVLCVYGARTSLLRQEI